MFLSWSLVFTFICFHCLQAEEYESFKGHQVFRLTPHSHSQVSFLSKLEEQVPELDFWSQPYNLNHDVDVRVPPNLQSFLKNQLIKKGIRYSIFIRDVQRLLDAELESMRHSRKKRDTTGEAEELNYEVLNSFTSHENINKWLEQITRSCGARCSIHDIGYTHENRTIRLIQISGLRRRNGNNNSIWIDGGIHGREWISPVTANNIIDKLVNNYNRSRCVRHIVENFNWYILPVANPDGYEYSRIRNRMWRKNRRLTNGKPAPQPWWIIYYYGRSGSSRRCSGVDLNRNFGFQWGVVGTSRSPCSDIYGGAKAFSEPESVAIRDFLTDINSTGNLVVYLSLHSYGQFWLYSWGYTRQLPEDHADLDRVASDSAMAIYRATNGKTQYTVGAAARTLYVSSGASDDWSKGDLGIKYAFTLELPPSDANARSNGFLLPVSAIPEVVEATWPGITTMASRVLQLDRKRGAVRRKHNYCNFYGY